MNDKLFYFSKSANKKAGEGVNEYVRDKNEYKELNKIKDWRKILSNFYIAPFTLDGYKFASVEHYYHYRKFNKNNLDFALTFTYNSNASYSKDSTKAKSAGSKTGKGRESKYKNIKIDPNFYNSKNIHDVFVKSMFSKFTQNPQLINALLYTNNAELLHGTRGKPIERMYSLEQVRKCIRKYKDIVNLSKIRL